MQRLRIGIVGCGEVTQIIHLPSLAHLAEQFAVTALCDVSQHVLQTVGDQWHVPAQYHDYRDLVAVDDVDAVLVANPDAYHAEAYDAITMALLAIEQAGSEDRGKIRDALSQVAFDSTRGPFKFDEKGDPLLVTHVVKIVDGKETNGRDIPVQK